MYSILFTLFILFYIELCFYCFEKAKPSVSVCFNVTLRILKVFCFLFKVEAEATLRAITIASQVGTITFE